MFRYVLASVAIVLHASAVFAHDMWIEPATYLPNSGDLVALRLRVGENLLGDPLARDARLIREFIVEDADGRRPVVGRDGADPAGLIRTGAAGLAVVGYHSTASVVEMTAQKFNQYLREEGLDAIAASRERAGTGGAGARDAFTRCAKSLLLAGASDRAHRDRVLGLPLELVAERNPYALPAGRELPVRLTYRGRALPGALVVAFNRKNPSEKQSIRTDRDGRVILRIPAAGTWIVKAVHMVPAAAGTEADWESYWASLTFGPGASSGVSPSATASATATR